MVSVQNKWNEVQNDLICGLKAGFITGIVMTPC